MDIGTGVIIIEMNRVTVIDGELFIDYVVCPFGFRLRGVAQVLKGAGKMTHRGCTDVQQFLFQPT